MIKTLKRKVGLVEEVMGFLTNRKPWLQISVTDSVLDDP